MSKKICDLCQQQPARDTRFGVNLCGSCLEGYEKSIGGDVSVATFYSDPQNFPYATNLAKNRIIDAVAKKYRSEEDIQQELQRLERAEQQRQAFAKSFGEFYEYDVVTIINEGHGQVDKSKMLQVLSERARQGWKLHTIYSNELGKNAITLLGLNVNSTASEDVLIFERRIEKI